MLHADRQSSQHRIARLVRRWGRAPVLDVGAAGGFLGQLLHDEGFPVDAIEPHADWAAQAQPFYRRVFQTRVEDAPLPRDAYEVVVCGDVLEHLVDPATVLRQLRTAATSDALFIISLPNIAHLSARLLLLLGRFPRMERGIFDRTHLHFYTRATARELIESAGLTALSWQTTPVPLGEVLRPLRGTPLLRGLMALQRCAARLAPSLFAYQWIVVATSQDSARSRRVSV